MYKNMVKGFIENYLKNRGIEYPRVYELIPLSDRAAAYKAWGFTKNGMEYIHGKVGIKGEVSIDF